tara:strand:- start:570 stop:749 length:180 start_codon:yes stop_codon:yes gene_type:complete
MGAKFYIKNPRNGDIIKTNAQTAGAANKRANSLDQQYGSNVHIVVPIKQVKKKTNKKSA